VHRSPGLHPRYEPRQVTAQPRHRVAGIIPDGATRRSACTSVLPGRSPRDGSANRWEFGYKAQVVDNDDGVVLDHKLEQGNPPDAPQLTPAVERVKRRTGRKPKTVTADRG